MHPPFSLDTIIIFNDQRASSRRPILPGHTAQRLWRGHAVLTQHGHPRRQTELLQGRVQCAHAVEAGRKTVNDAHFQRLSRHIAFSPV
jgi:hypothetical protein